MRYAIYHIYDEDDGFGDAVEVEELVALCASKARAEAYAKKHDKTHVYDKPYASLKCGKLVVRDLSHVKVITKENMDESPWEGNSLWVLKYSEEDDENE